MKTTLPSVPTLSILLQVIDFKQLFYCHTSFYSLKNATGFIEQNQELTSVIARKPAWYQQV
jgi:hypothetical protein